MRPTLLLGAVLGASCSGLPTGPTNPETAQEQAIAEHTRCLAEFHGRAPRVEIHNEPHPDHPTAQGWTTPGSGVIHYRRGAISLMSDMELAALAAHEVCHEFGWWGEPDANKCAHFAIQYSGCVPNPGVRVYPRILNCPLARRILLDCDRAG